MHATWAFAAHLPTRSAARVDSDTFGPLASRVPQAKWFTDSSARYCTGHDC